MLRTLECSEQNYVYGGTGEVGQDCILVVATPDMIRAAAMAYDQARIDVYILGALAAGAGAYFSSGSALGQAFVGAAGFVGGVQVEDFIHERAQELFSLDGADGTYDGNIEGVLPGQTRASN